MTLLFLALLLGQAPVDGAPAATPGDRHGLGEEVITAQAEVKIADIKYYFAPQIDPFSPINDLLVPDDFVFDEALYRTIDSLTVPHHFTRSSYLRVPVERDFIYNDIMVFLPSFERRVATWELVVSNSMGETVRRVSHRGHPPAMMSWDGRDDSGEPIATGEVYSFTFNAYDAQGNQTRIPGEPRRINGLVSQQGNEWVVSIAADRLFVEGNSRLLGDAGPRLDEAANIIREKYRKEVVAYVYSEQERLSTERVNVIKAELARRLVLPEGVLKVAPRFIPGLKPKLSKVEIHIL
ncbi:hypothetical protein JXB37_04280 [candidate division WOR-3 bacterium]|nr:hypothetical protein [candidate division WOR-3 bacterium]